MIVLRSNRMRARIFTPFNISWASKLAKSSKLPRIWRRAVLSVAHQRPSDDVDFSTGSVGLGAAMTIFASMAQDYVRAHGLGYEREPGRMIALVGDAELDEGNIYEALLEGWKYGLRNAWWIIDYNRQSLDAVVHEDLHSRFEQMFGAMGWEKVIVQIWKTAASSLRGARRRSSQAMDRWRTKPALFGTDVPGRSGLAEEAGLDDLGDQGACLPA